jgi:hypothetical protein
MISRSTGASCDRNGNLADRNGNLPGRCRGRPRFQEVVSVKFRNYHGRTTNSSGRFWYAKERTEQDPPELFAPNSRTCFAYE